MKNIERFIVKTLFVVGTVLFGLSAWGFTGDGMPLKFISSCEIDLNGDSKADKAILIEGLAGRELIALIAKKNGYEAFVVSSGKPHMYLNCKMGAEVKETEAGGGKGKVHKTPGAFLELIKPESSSVAFIWQDKAFKEVWTAD